MDGTANLQAEFTAHLLSLAQRSNDELHFHPGYFIKMVKIQGGVGAAKTRLAKPSASEGFDVLKKLSRLDLSMEAAVIELPWASMFTTAELAIARAPGGRAMTDPRATPRKKLIEVSIPLEAINAASGASRHDRRRFFGRQTGCNPRA